MPPLQQGGTLRARLSQLPPERADVLQLRETGTLHRRVPVPAVHTVRTDRPPGVAVQGNHRPQPAAAVQRRRRQQRAPALPVVRLVPTRHGAVPPHGTLGGGVGRRAVLDLWRTRPHVLHRVFWSPPRSVLCQLRGPRPRSVCLSSAHGVDSVAHRPGEQLAVASAASAEAPWACSWA